MYPDDVRYAETHEWVRQDDESSVTIGISEFAQEELGDVVFVDLPTMDRHLAKGEGFGSIESVKTVSELYAPVAGTVIATNTDLGQHPELVNSDPYGQGWLIRVRLTDEADMRDLLSAADYKARIE